MTDQRNARIVAAEELARALETGANAAGGGNWPPGSYLYFDTRQGDGQFVLCSRGIAGLEDMTSLTSALHLRALESRLGAAAGVGIPGPVPGLRSTSEPDAGDTEYVRALADAAEQSGGPAPLPVTLVEMLSIDATELANALTELTTDVRDGAYVGKVHGAICAAPSSPGRFGLRVIRFP